MTSKRIYLDYNATTPCDPRVIDAMLPFFYEHPGNAASRNHPFGWEAEDAVTTAREQIADLINVETKEIVFTSGATESNNLALRGVFEMYRRKGKHIITVSTEHKAVLDTCKYLEKHGGEVTYLDVDKKGLIDLEALKNAIREDTILVSIMWGNNETGVLQPMEEIGEICQEKGVLLFSDATQVVGKIPVAPKDLGIHLMAFTAHKMYGPKGVGALYVSRKSPRVKVTEQMSGGGHEGGMRSGTLNVPGIVGFGKATAIAKEEMAAETLRLEALRNKLEQALLEQVEASSVNGSRSARMPHVTNISFQYVDSEGLLMTFNQNIAVSTGSACTSASLDPSHVLTGMGIEDDLAKSSIRFSLGRFTTEEEIDTTIKAVVAGIEQLRALSPVWELHKDGRI